MVRTHIKQGEWSLSSTLGGKKNENIFFCWVGVETGLGAHLCRVEKKTKWKKDTSDPHNKFTHGTTRTAHLLCTHSTLSIF